MRKQLDSAAQRHESAKGKEQSMEEMLRNRMIYKTINKKSVLAKGGLCKIKLCQNVAHDIIEE